MPHFIIDCSEDILQLKTAGEIMNVVYEAADATGLFAPNDIKVRLQPYQYYRLAEHKKTSCMSSDTLWKDELRNRKPAYQDRSVSGLRNCFPIFLFCRSTSVRIRSRNLQQ